MLETGQLLSRLTGTATVIAQSAGHRVRRSSSFGSCGFRRDRALAVLVTRSGGVENRVVVTELKIDDHTHSNA